jgi:hypothetical protein
MRPQRPVHIFIAAAILLCCHAVQADVVLDWNETALAQVLAARQAPPDGTRTMAMMHVAVFDAVNAIERRYKPYAYEHIVSNGASPESAAVAAAHAILVKLFPDQVQALQVAYTASLSSIAGASAKTAGVALGEEVASRVLAMRAQDGAGAPGPYRQKIVPGVYVPTAFPVSSEWAKVKPWFMHEPAQFRPPPPPALTSTVWSRDLEEIRAVGGKNSVARTAEQSDVARFWTITGPASWNPIVRALAQSHKSSLLDNARLFALVNMAASDAFIAVFDAKYAYEFWRPVTAIRYSGEAAWLPLVETPMHPEYPCAHCISAAAVAAVLEFEYGMAPRRSRRSRW